jgi:hypothetical protein
MFRLYFSIFWGKEQHYHHTPHEAPKVMTIPLMLLSLGAIFAGFLPFARLLLPTANHFIPYRNGHCHSGSAGWCSGRTYRHGFIPERNQHSGKNFNAGLGGFYQQPFTNSILMRFIFSSPKDHFQLCFPSHCLVRPAHRGWFDERDFLCDQ